MPEVRNRISGEDIIMIVFFLLVGSLILLGISSVYRKDPETVLWANIVAAAGFFIIAVILTLGIIITIRSALQSPTLDNGLSLSGGLSDLEHAVAQLGKNYDILRRQANQGFLLACTLMALGFLVILAGSLGQLLGLMETTNDLTIVAGIVVEAVSALGLVLFRETSKRLSATSDRLHEIWRVLAAFKQAESLEGDKKTEMQMILIGKLAGLPRSEISEGKLG